MKINRLRIEAPSFPAPQVLLFLMFAGLALSAQGQAPNFRLHFPATSLTLAENARSLENANFASEPLAMEGKVFKLVQFERIPTAAEKSALENLGVHLLHYVRNYAWFASVETGLKGSDLAPFPIRLLSDIRPEWKLSKMLLDEDYPGHALVDADHIQLEIHYLDGLSQVGMATALAEAGAEIGRRYENSSFLEITLPVANLSRLAEIPFLYFISPLSPEATPEIEVDRANHRSNCIATDYLGGLQFNGKGVTAAVSEGMVDTTLIDFHGRINPSYHTASGFSGHATGVCQRMAGAGNRNPLDRGMAFGANILTVDGIIWNSPGLYNSDSLRVANHSYGWGCSSGYNGGSATIDNQIRTQPSMMHVFSAGNIGNDSSCAYYGVPGWANITGAPKQAKNPIATGALNIYDQVTGFSSKGPAYDGRIKPDICAVGPGGTSHASPGVAGAYTQLMQVYKSLHNGQEPDAGMLKCILQNTADDLGNPGPDFHYGYGRINVRRAYDLISQGQHLTDSVGNGSTQLHSITVPNGVRDLRIMVYWSDYEATPGAPIALVNDLDLQVTDPSQSNFAPWVLDHSPNLASITSPATRGRDSLNNMEQVTITNPISGNYSIQVTGNTVPYGPQKYYLVYEFLYDELTLTYPVGAEGFVPGENEVIRWDSYGNQGTFDLEFSADNGANWSTIATGIGASLRYYDFQVPDTLSGHCMVRVKRGALSSENSVPFSIIRVPQNLGIGWTCGDTTMFTWDAVAGATGYEVSRLGAKYMDSTGTTANTHYMFTGLNLSGTEWFSVRALGNLDAEGRRAIAYQWSPGNFNCVPANAALDQVISPAPGYLPDCFGADKFPVTVQLVNQGTGTLANIPVHYQVNGGAVYNGMVAGPIASLGQAVFTFPDSVSFPGVGTYNITVWTNYPGDPISGDDSLVVQVQTYASTAVAPPTVQNFDLFSNCSTAWGCEDISCGLLDGWYNVPNTPAAHGDSIDFRTHSGATGTGGTGPSADHTSGTGKYLYLEGSGNGGSGCLNKLASLHSPCIDLSNTNQPQMSFWYHMYGNGIGTLNVDAFVDGGWDMNIMTEISGNQGNNWLQRSVDLSAYQGKKVFLRFRATTGNSWTSDMALDDINLDTKPVLAFGADRLNLCVGDTVQLTDSSSHINSWLWSISGGAYAFVNGTSSTSQNPAVVLYDPVTYSVTLTGTNTVGFDSLVRTNYLNAGNHVVSLVATDTSICAGDAVSFAASFPDAEKFIFSLSGFPVQNSPLSSFTSSSLVDGDIVSVYAQLYPGCYTDTAQVIMAVDNPIAGVIGIDSSMCPLISFSGSSSGGDPDQWTWDFGDASGTATLQNPSYDYSLSGNGTYLVQLITQNECGPDTVVVNLTIGCLVSAALPDARGALQVFPNPTGGMIRVESPVMAGNSYSLVLSDLRGKEVLRSDFLAEADWLEESLDLGGIAHGMYHLVLRGREGVWGVKVVVD